MECPGSIHPTLLPGSGQPVPGGRQRDIDPGGRRDRSHLGGPLPQTRHGRSTRGRSGPPKAADPCSLGGSQVGTKEPAQPNTDLLDGTASQLETPSLACEALYSDKIRLLPSTGLAPLGWQRPWLVGLQLL